MGHIVMKDVLRYAWMEFGELSVMRNGIMMLLKWPVVNWDTLRVVWRERKGGKKERERDKLHQELIISIMFCTCIYI